MSLNDFKKFAVDGERYQDYLLDRARAVTNKVINTAYMEAGKGNNSAKEIVNLVKQAKSEREALVRKEEQSYQRVLKQEARSEARSGFINASILLYVVLLFGILLACALIILQN